MRRVVVILGTEPATGHPTPSILPESDRAAMSLALSRFGGRVDACCLRDDEEAARYALAAGAAEVLRPAEVTDLEFDVALVGSGGAGAWGDLLPALIAEWKDCAMVLEVLDVEPRDDGMTVTRDLGRGSREILAVRGPAVLAVSENAPRSLYISRHRREAVDPSLIRPGTGPAATDPLSGICGPWEHARPRPRAADLEGKTGGSATDRMNALLGLADDPRAREDTGRRIIADAGTCANHLLRFLRHHRFIDGTASVPEEPAAGPQRPGHPPDDTDPSGVAPSDPRRAGSRARRGPRPIGGTEHRGDRSPRSIPDDKGSVS